MFNMIKRTENWLLVLTYRVQLGLLLYLHCTQYQPFLQEFLSVTVPSTSESHHSALGPSSLVVVLCQMGCYVPVQEYSLFICSLFNHVSRLVKGNNSVNQTGLLTGVYTGGVIFVRVLGHISGIEQEKQSFHNAMF